MGLFDSKSSLLAPPKENPLLLPGEAILSTFKLIIDELIITDRRLIFTDNKVLSAKKKTVSIGFNKITSVELERGGVWTWGQEITVVCGSKEYEVKGADPKATLEIYNLIISKIM